MSAFCLFVCLNLLVQEVDISAAHGDCKVTRLQVFAKILLRVIEGGRPDGIQSVLLHALDELAAVQSRIVLTVFAGTEDVRHDRNIRLFRACQIILEQMADAVKRMWLHNSVERPFAPFTGNGNGIAHFRRIVSVIVEHLRTVEHACLFKAAMCTREMMDAFCRLRQISACDPRSRNCSKRILHVEQSRHAHDDMG